MKRTLSYSLSLVLAVLMSASVSYAQKPTNERTEEKKREYLAVVAKLKKGDPDVHFGHLRRAYVEWIISGGESEEHPKRAEMVEAIQSQKHAEAVKLADEVLEMEFFNHNIFGAISDSYKALDDKKNFDYFNDLYHKAQHGLFLSGDGKTAETAYYAFSISEEYRVMRELGLRTQSQSLHHVGGQSYDVLSGVDGKGNEVSVYFNICFFFPCGSVPR